MIKIYPLNPDLGFKLINFLIINGLRSIIPKGFWFFVPVSKSPDRGSYLLWLSSQGL